MGNICLGPGGCCCTTPMLGPPPTYVGPVGIPAPIGVGFGSVQGGCCACLLGSTNCCGLGGGCCAPDPFPVHPGQVGCGRCCSCCAQNVPLYTNTFAPDPPLKTVTPVITTQAQMIQYVYNQGPPTVAVPPPIPTPVAMIQPVPEAQRLMPPPIIRTPMMPAYQMMRPASPVPIRQLPPMQPGMRRGISPMAARPLSPSPLMRPPMIPAIVQSDQLRVMASPLAKLTTSIISPGPRQVIEPPTPFPQTLSYDFYPK